MIQKYFSFMLIVFLFLSNTNCSINRDNQNLRVLVDLSISTDKEIYNQTEDCIVTVKIKNNSPNQLELWCPDSIAPAPLDFQLERQGDERISGKHYSGYMQKWEFRSTIDFVSGQFITIDSFDTYIYSFVLQDILINWDSDTFFEKKGMYTLSMTYCTVLDISTKFKVVE